MILVKNRVILESLPHKLQPTQIRMMRHKMYVKTFKSAKKMTNGNYVTHNTKHTILINKTKFTPYSVPPAHAPVSVSASVTQAQAFSAGIMAGICL